MCLQTGRGYNKYLAPNAGGIQLKRLNPTLPNIIELSKLELFALLNEGRQEEAFEVLLNAPATDRQKEVFFKKYF